MMYRQLDVAKHPQPVRVFDDEVYTVEQATFALDLRNNSLKLEIRKGRLKAKKRCGRYWILGKWLKEWIESGGDRKPESEASREKKGRMLRELKAA